MSKHQEILEYLEKLAVGKRVSVRSISNHLKVSDGTAYRAIKEAENRGIVETKPRSGTVRVEKKNRVRIDKLTYTEISRISDSTVVAGQAGLSHEFSKFSIGAMTEKNIRKYLVKGGLVIVGDREEIQLVALENQNAILVTGGFPISQRVIAKANQENMPVMVTNYDTFTVATLINHALLNFRIKTDLKTVKKIMIPAEEYGFLSKEDTISKFNHLIKETQQVRFPVVDADHSVVGVVSMRDVVDQSSDITIGDIMTENVISATPNISLANIGQKMIFEDLNMLPVVNQDNLLLGVITRRLAMESLQNNDSPKHNTYSEQVLNEIEEVGEVYHLLVEPSMIDSSGNLAHGVFAEIIKDVAMKVFTRKYQKNIIIEQMMLYFLQVAQIDDQLSIEPKIITENRKSGVIDFELRVEEQVVAKAVVACKIN